MPWSSKVPSNCEEVLARFVFAQLRSIHTTLLGEISPRPASFSRKMCLTCQKGKWIKSRRNLVESGEISLSQG